MSSPLEKYNERNINRWDIMVDFPAWEEDSILYWIKSVLHKSGYNRLGRQDAVYNPQVLADIQKMRELYSIKILESTFQAGLQLNRHFFHF